MTKDELIAFLASNNLSELSSVLVPRLRPSVGLALTPADEGTLPVGATKLGGHPDLPPGFNWPTGMTYPFPKLFGLRKPHPVPLSFIAQVNLAEVSPHDETGLLPAHGMLYFFYTPEQDAWGSDARDADKFSVHYYDGDISTLEPTDLPENLGKKGRYKAAAASPVKQTSWPSLENVIFRKIDEEALETLSESELVNMPTKMLGYADPVQGEMEVECELVMNQSASEKGRPARAAYDQLQAEAEQKWILLLQVDSNGECGMMWGDAGMLYYWIRLEDLQNRDFSRCWLQLQCC